MSDSTEQKNRDAWAFRVRGVYGSGKNLIRVLAIDGDEVTICRVSDPVKSEQIITRSGLERFLDEL